MCNIPFHLHFNMEIKSFVQNFSESFKQDFLKDIWIDFEQKNDGPSKIEFLVRSTPILKHLYTSIESEIKTSTVYQESIKNNEKASILKQEGNLAFGQRKYKEALAFYTKAILFTDPIANAEQFGVLYGNRSAAFYHLNKYESTLDDICEAFNVGFPQELTYKLFERAAQCHLRLGNNVEAKRKFQQALNALEKPNLKLNETAKTKLKESINQNLRTKCISNFNFVLTDDNSRKMTANQKLQADLPKLVNGNGSYLQNASSNLKLMENENEGRFIVACKKINPGDVILVEKAFVSTLTEEAYNYQCFQCFKRLEGGSLPCNNCPFAMYCSKQCRESANSTHHQYECPIMGILCIAKVSITCLMVFRVLTQTKQADLTKCWAEANIKNGDKKGCPVYNGDLKSILKLVSHSDRRKSEDFYYRSVMAIFLSILIHSTKSGKAEFEGKQKSYLNIDELDIDSIIENGSIALRLLEIMQFNAHEIAGWDESEKKTAFLGAGLFPTLAFFNHSCDPTIVRYFVNDIVIVRAVRTVHPGEQVTENYGPIFTQMPKLERQAQLENRYWFTCSCKACVEDWPLFQSLSKHHLNLRCSNCFKFLCRSDSPDIELLLRCKSCLKPTNLLSKMKQLEKTEKKYHEAIDWISKGKLVTGEAILLETLSLFDSILLPPFPDYINCQEGLRKCYLPLGNKCFLSQIKTNDKINHLH